MNKKPSKKWLTLLENKKEFSALVSFLQSKRVKCFEYDGIRLDFQEVKYVSAGEPKIDTPPVISDEQKQKEEEEILFWSSGG